MKRRTVLGGLLALAPGSALAQSGRQPIPQVGLVRVGRGPAFQTWIDSFRAGLRERGHVEGETVIFEVRYAEAGADGIRAGVAELVRRRFDVLLTPNTQTAQLAREVTETVPIVMTGNADPLRTGLIASLSRPGRNVTGLSISGPDLMGKRLDLIRQLLPTLSCVGFLGDPAEPPSRYYAELLADAARQVGMTTVAAFAARSGEEVRAALADLAARGAGVVVVQPIFTSLNDVVVESLRPLRLPAVSDLREAAQAGYLFSYGPNITDSYRRAATYVDKILRGANPKDLPVEEISTFELVLNAGTARALGIPISAAVLARADEVID